jgi:hypothetical protein
MKKCVAYPQEDQTNQTKINEKFPKKSMFSTLKV